MLTTDLLMSVHLLAMAGFLGVQLAVLYMLLPAAETARDEPHRRAVLIEGFRFYNPFSLAMLGVMVITGAMRLTDLKAAMQFSYFGRIGNQLAFKLALVFVLVFLQTYVTFGLAFRIGRQEEVAAHGDGPPFTVEKINSMLARIRATIWVTVILTAVIVYVSLRMAHAIGG